MTATRAVITLLTLLSLAALLGGAVGTALWYGDVINYEWRADR